MGTDCMDKIMGLDSSRLCRWLAVLAVAWSVNALAECPLVAQALSPRPFIAFGDSITLGLGDPGVSCEDSSSYAGYPPRLQTALAREGFPTELKSLGICGETTQEALSRIDGVLTDARDLGLFVLMEGTNDISVQISPETIRFNLNEMARRADGYRLETIYSSIIPRSPEASPDSNNAAASVLRDLLEADAIEEQRPFADPFTALLDQPDVFENLYRDPFHTNAEGYDVVADAFLNPARAAISQIGSLDEGPCEVSPTQLCLNEGRFAIVVDWIKPDGERGIGRAETLTEDTGYFYFFRDTNIELVIKVLDGRNNNGHFWVFYGALSNVEYAITVRDSETGVIKRYENAPGSFASVGDTRAFPVPDSLMLRHHRQDRSLGESTHFVNRSASGTARTAPTRSTAVTAGIPGCVEDEQTLCLNEGRFAVRVDWRKPDGEEGVGTTLPQTADTGMFYFFRESNIELILKVLDGRNTNGHFWVFYGALSNVEYTITVTDTVDGREKVYTNPSGAFASVGDTQAFPTPPDG